MVMNEKQKAYTFLAGCGIILFVFGIMWASIIMLTLPKYYEKVKCYDRWQNEIVGQTCLEEHQKYSVNLILPSFMAFSGVCFIIIAVHALSLELDLEEERNSLNALRKRRIDLNKQKEVYKNDK